MPKLPRLTAKDIKRMLEKKGFILVRQSGSHMIYRNKDSIRITVPFHGSKILQLDPNYTNKKMELILDNEEFSVPGFVSGGSEARSFHQG